MTDDPRRAGAHELLSHQVRPEQTQHEPPPPAADVARILAVLDGLAPGLFAVFDTKAGETQYELRAERFGPHWLSVSVRVNGGLEIAQVACPSARVALDALRVLLFGNREVPYLAALAVVGPPGPFFRP